MSELTLTKFGHACIRITSGGTTLVVDPGGYTEPEAIDGADAILLTHEHGDHFVEHRVREALDANPALEIWTNAATAAQLEGAGPRVHVVGADDAFSVGGIDITVHGEWHEVVHPDMPQAKNIGFLIAGSVFHPGDAFTVPGAPVGTLVLPVHAPWNKVSEVIDYVRAVAPKQALAGHDGFLNEAGLGLLGRVLGPGGLADGVGYTRVEPGSVVPLPV